MSIIQKRRCLVLLVLVIAVALLLPVVFGEPRSIKDQSGGNSWRNFISDFQTLITGVLAIGAAYFTIRTSQKIDKEADRRHHELVGLTLRADRLRVERLLHPALDELFDLRYAIGSINIPVLKEMIRDGEPKAVREVLETVDWDVWTVKRTLSSKPFPETADLFDGPLNYQYDMVEKLTVLVREVAGRASNTCDKLFAALKRDQIEKRDGAEKELLAELETLQSHIKDYLDNYDEFLKSLEEMKREYRIK